MFLFPKNFHYALDGKSHGFQLLLDGRAQRPHRTPHIRGQLCSSGENLGYASGKIDAAGKSIESGAERLRRLKTLAMVIELLW